MAKNPFENKWVKGDRIGKGGQGLTYHAKSNPDDGKAYALKLLKEQRSQDRRERMYIEVTALQILQHPSIPKYFDSNASNYANNAEDLYLITEFIPGRTLEDFIGTNGILPLSEAIVLTLKLVDTIAFCHLKDFFHRDIKPDNIILKDNSIENPFLIDFGLSFNEEIIKAETPSWEHIGNRFLALPELRVREGNKKDYRSDITMLSGIFLFCLTGIHPTDLLDEKQTKPHRREKSKSILESLDKLTIAALNRLFDISFNVSINDRWQSVESLKLALTDLQNIKSVDETNGSDIVKRLDQYKQRIEQREDFRQLAQIRGLFAGCDKAIRKACETVINQLGPSEFGSIQSNYSLNLEKQLFSNKFGIKHPYSEKLTFLPKFTCYVNGSEIVLEAIENGTTRELLRHPLNEKIDWKRVEAQLEDYYIEGVILKEDL